MRTWLVDAPIRRKLTLVTTMTTAVALVIAAGALGTYEVAAFHRALARKLTTIADIVGRNCTAALAFGDRSVARDVLAGLEAEPGIEAGSVYDREGRLFAGYGDDRRVHGGLPQTTGELDNTSGRRTLVAVRPIVLDGERIGTVYLRSTLDELDTRMLLFTIVTLTVVVGSTLIALLVSTGLHRWISAPILDLARTARMVTSDRNFALRAGSGGRDEVGTLVEDFNRMLAEIERQDHQLRDHQEQLEVQVAQRTAELVEANDRLVASVRRAEYHTGQIAQLTALGQHLQACQTAAEVFGVIQHAMSKLFPADSGALMTLNSSRNLMEAVAIWGDAPPKQRVFAPEDCWAFRRSRPHLAASADSPLQCAHLQGERAPVALCVPLLAHGDHLGVLQLEFAAAGDEPDDTEETGSPHSTRGRLAVAAAEQIALALANLRLREALRNQSVVDPLTGLFNRRYLEEVLERECRRAVRAERCLSLLMIDVDHFKRFNDMWGHEAGDAVLRAVAGLLRAHFRGEDVACRYGGEEFVALLTDAPPDATYARAEELRAMISHLSVQHRKQTLGSITISIGLAVLPDHGLTPQMLIDAADAALYEAKTAGRDRTVRAPAAPAQTARTDHPALAAPPGS